MAVASTKPQERIVQVRVTTEVLWKSDPRDMKYGFSAISFVGKKEQDKEEKVHGR